MRVGVPKETAAGERRVALVPEIVSKLDGIDIVIEPGAGEAASFTDESFTEAGATLGDPWDTDLVAKVRKPSEEELGRLHDGQVLIGFLQPLTDANGIEQLASACRHTRTPRPASSHAAANVVTSSRSNWLPAHRSSSSSASSGLHGAR